MVSGNNQPMRNHPAMSVTNMALILPTLSAFCTSASFASLSFIRIRKVPKIEAIIPTPAMAKGNKIGPKPLNASVNCAPVASVISFMI